MRIGILGVGTAGLMHARNAAQTGQVDELVLIGRSRPRLNARLEELERALAPGADPEIAGHRIPTTDRRPTRISIETDLDRGLDGLDGVVIASATPAHPEHIRRAVAAGVPVMVEKPLAADMDDTLALETELAAADVPVMIAYPRRYDPGFLELQSRISSSDAGPVRLAHLEAHDHHQVARDYIPVSGGLLRDMAIHDIDAALWLLGGDVDTVYATGSVSESPMRDAFLAHGDIETAALTLTFASGALALISVARNIGRGQNVRMEVHCTDEVFVAGLDERSPFVSTEPGVPAPGQVYEDYRDRLEPGFRGEMAHFLALVEGRAENRTPPSIAAPALRIALAAERSLATGEPVRLSEFAQTGDSHA